MYFTHNARSINAQGGIRLIQGQNLLNGDFEKAQDT